MRMMGRGSVAIVAAAPVKYRNRDAEFRYRQDSDFYYLTGFPEPEAVAVFCPGRRHGQFVLFCRERNPEQEVWTGTRAGQEGARERYGADDSFPIGDIDDILPGLIEGKDRVYYTLGADPEFDRRVIGWVRQVRGKARAGVHAPEAFVSLEHLVHDMRLYKSRSEQAAMRRAARISAEAHRRAMTVTRPGMMEYEVEAELLHTFRRHGGEAAYSSIVGGGANACVLHYVENDSRLNDGDLLLIDAAAEYDYYAADITRTFPVNGRFSSAQRELYDVVLEAQAAAIAAVRPGRDWSAPHEAAVRVLTRGLVDLGLLRGQVRRLVAEGAYRRYYMHRTGHWLGMDVHDVGDYKVGERWRELEPGMTLTVEPGLYIPPDARGVARRWRGTGIRIEDDVLVTDGAPEVLSAGVPRDPDEIEALMATGGGR